MERILPAKYAKGREKNCLPFLSFRVFRGQYSSLDGKKEKGPLTGKGNGPISSYFYPISSQEHCADMTFTSVPINR